MLQANNWGHAESKFQEKRGLQFLTRGLKALSIFRISV